MIKKLFFVSTLFLLTSFSDSSALTETQTKQTIKTPTTPIKPKITLNIDGESFVNKKTFAKTKNVSDIDYLLELYANDKWGFMGKKFIDEWQTIYNQYINSIIYSYSENKIDKDIHISLWMIENSFLLALALLLPIALHENKKIKLDEHWPTVFTASLTIFITCAIVTAKLHKKYYKKQCDKEIARAQKQYNQDKQNAINTRNKVTDFFNNFLGLWEVYKKITPIELHYLFNKLNSETKNIDINDIIEIITKIQRQIRNNHSVYYEEYKQEITKPPVTNHNYYNTYYRY